jgi:hypothetical protein
MRVFLAAFAPPSFYLYYYVDRSARIHDRC